MCVNENGAQSRCLASPEASPQAGSVGAAVSPPRPRRLGLKKNFGWAFAGNAVYQACQWLVLVVLAKLLTATDVGLFALALAICTPIMTFSGLNLRAVQVTDAREEHRFGHFLSLQLFNAALALVVIAGIVLVSGYGVQTACLIIAVGLGQAVVLVRDVFIAFSQKHERMDAVGVSKAVLGVASISALSLTVWLTRNLLAGVVAMQAAKLLVFLGWDLRATGRLVAAYVNEPVASYLRPIWQPRIMLSLAWLALPLGLTTVLVAVYNNLPRYFIAAFLDEERLGYFAAIMALAMAGTMVTTAAGMSALPRLSRYAVENRTAYFRLLFQLVLFGAGFGLLGLLVVALAGEPLLRIIFTADYADHSDLFMWSMVFAAVTYAVTFLGYGLTALRRFRLQVLPYGAALAVSAVAAWLLIPAHGIVAGAWCLILGKVAQASLTVLLIGLCVPQAEDRPSAVPEEI